MATKFTDILQKSMMLCSTVRRKSVGAGEDGIGFLDPEMELVTEYRHELKNHGKKPHLNLNGFKWSSKRITEQELVLLVREALDFVENKAPGENKIKKRNVSEEKFKEWELFYEKKNLQVWRKPMNSGGLYEYKAYGSFFDITPDDFYQSQVDSEYRKNWDGFTLELDVIDKDHSSDNEVHHWALNFPQPLKNRDFVYLRKSWVCNRSGAMIIVSRATDHPSRPEDEQKYVRVKDYKSEMVIMPHKNVKEEGLDFVLSFLYDPRLPAIPYGSFILTKFTELTGIPGMIQNCYNAAKGQKDYYAKKDFK